MVQIGFEEPLCASAGPIVRRFKAFGKLSEPLFLGVHMVPPGDQNILGVNLEVALDEKVQRVLRNLAEVQQIAAANVLELPEKFFEAIRETACLRRFTRRRTDDRGMQGSHCAGATSTATGLR